MRSSLAKVQTVNVHRKVVAQWSDRNAEVMRCSHSVQDGGQVG